jgi:hypothetical protein
MQPARGLAVFVFVTLISACGEVPPASSPSPVTQATQGPNVSPPASPPSPSPGLYEPPVGVPATAPTPLPLPAGAICRIPYADSSEANGGFIYFPSGERQFDPNSVVAMPGNLPGQVGQNSGLTFDRTLGRWVPVGRDWLAPNGLFYVYEDFDAHNIHGVTITDGSSANITTDGSWYPIAATDQGVYLRRLPTTPTGPGPEGIWYVPYGGIPNQIIDHGAWSTFADEALWGFDESGNLIRHKVGTGAESRWGQWNLAAWIVGFDLGGNPVVNTGGALVLYRADGTKVAIFTSANGIFAQGQVFVDTHGVWFQAGANLIGAPGSGIYLWTEATGAQLASPNDVHPAGVCGP